jgi:hypothetical protein
VQEDAVALQNKPMLMLTRPKEPEFQTAHRVRAVRVKSSAELEEEMLAKIPKFRARPFNKKVRIYSQLKICSTFNCLVISDCYVLFLLYNMDLLFLLLDC